MNKTENIDKKSLQKGRLKAYCILLAVSLLLTAFDIVLFNKADSSISKAVDCILYDNYDLQIDGSPVELTAHERLNLTKEGLRDRLDEYAFFQFDGEQQIVCCESGIGTRSVIKMTIGFGIFLSVLMLTGVFKEIFIEKTFP